MLAVLVRNIILCIQSKQRTAKRGIPVVPLCYNAVQLFVTTSQVW